MDKLRKIMLVIEDNGSDGGKGFNFYMSGDKDRLASGVKPEDMSPAEYWGQALFEICLADLKQAGVVRTQRKSEVH